MTQKKFARILIIGNDLKQIALEQSLLQKAGYNVLTATNFKDAVLSVADNLENLDLVVLDLFLDLDPQAGLKIAKFFISEIDLDISPDISKKESFFIFPGKILITAKERSINLAKEFEDLAIIGYLLRPYQQDDYLMAVNAALRLDSADLLLETGERVLYEWVSGKMKRQMLVDSEGNILKTGFWQRGGILSVCVPIATGYCPMRCHFCVHAYAPKGSTRKLSATDIINSIQTSLKGSLFKSPFETDEKFDVAFTGEGEPAQNLDAVIEAIYSLKSLYGDTIRRIIVSTVSSKTIKRLCQESFPLPVQLQISTVFAGENRQKYMPGASSLPELLELGADYYNQSQIKLPIILNHILIKGYSDTSESVIDLAKLIRKSSPNYSSCFKVKLSNFNPVKFIDWQASEGRALIVKRLFSRYKIPAFFWKIPCHRLELPVDSS